jgi:hypothetical protein
MKSGWYPQPDFLVGGGYNTQQANTTQTIC